MRTEKTYSYADVILESGLRLFIRASDENSYSLSGNKNTSRMHSHSFAELCLVTHGTAKCLCNYTSRIVSKGDLLIIDPNVQHVFVETSDFTCFTIGLEGMRFFTNESNFITKTEKSFSSFQSIFKLIVDETRTKESNYDKMLLNAINMLSILLTRRNIIDKVDDTSSTTPKLNSGVMVAKTYMDTYYSRDISLNSLCEIAYISPQHLIRQFKSLTGYTPKQYLNRIRIQVAAGAILDSYDSIKLIASSVGYSDYQAFLYTFKQFVGISPQQFREDYKHNAAEGRKLISFVSPENIASISTENPVKH